MTADAAPAVTAVSVTVSAVTGLTFSAAGSTVTSTSSVSQPTEAAAISIAATVRLPCCQYISCYQDRISWTMPVIFVLWKTPLLGVAHVTADVEVAAEVVCKVAAKVVGKVVITTIVADNRF